jgi:rare lipoprotein A (peptidoglycan hydrolase)
MLLRAKPRSRPFGSFESFRAREVGLPGKDFLVKQGFQRSLVIWMLAAASFVYAEPLSFSQDLVLRPEPVSPAVSAWAERSPAAVSEPVFYGTASWYSRSDRGIKKRTASGAIFDHSKRACAAWGFPLGTRLRVTNLRNGRSVICVVNDRGPAKKLKRLVDLTKATFRDIADPRQGLVRVSVVPLGPASKWPV